METEHASSPYAVSLKQNVTALIAKHKAGESQDIYRIAQGIWAILYEQIPQLTHSKHKADQHKVLEDCLLELGLPKSNDLQWIAGPMLWYAREIHLLPPVQNNGTKPEPWILDKERYERKRKAIVRGLTYYSDWIMNNLQSLLYQQQ